MRTILGRAARTIARRGAHERPERLRHYDGEQDAREAMSVIRDNTMLSYERLVTLWQQVRYADRARLDGALVECGTWRGGASGMMAMAHLASGAATRELHLFDSFQGLPQPDAAVDGQLAIDYAAGEAVGALAPIGQLVGPLEDNRALLRDRVGYPPELTRYHVGWFQDTVPPASVEIGRIAVLRLDGDWYESTKVCLDHLFPLVVSGGIVVIDDYGKWPGCRQAVDEHLARLPRPLYLHHIDPAGRYLVVP